MQKGKEIADSKRKLVLYLMGGEKSNYDIREHLKLTKGRISQLTTEMNEAGLLLFHNDKHGDRMVKLNKDNLMTEHSSDMYIPDVIFTILTLLLAVVISVFSPIWFLFGALFATILTFFRIFWKILRHPDYVKFFQKATATQEV